MKPSILVTGAAGFIGANFINRLVNKYNAHNKYTLVVLDALTYAGRKDNIVRAIDQGVEFIHGNICDQKTISDLFEKFNFSGLINFAAESHVDRSISGPKVFLDTNVSGTMNLL